MVTVSPEGDFYLYRTVVTIIFTALDNRLLKMISVSVLSARNTTGVAGP